MGLPRILPEVPASLPKVGTASLIEASYDRGVDDATARIVTFLRQFYYDAAADAIERGLHLGRK